MEEKVTNGIEAVETRVIGEFKRVTAGVDPNDPRPSEQERLLTLSLPFHRKLKELGLKASESALRLTKALTKGAEVREKE